MRYWPALVVSTLLCTTPTTGFAQVAMPDGAAAPVTDTSSAPADDAPDQVPLPGARPFVPLGPAPGPIDRTSIRSLFIGLGGDLREAARPDNALILLGTGAAAAFIHPYDHRLTDHFSQTPAFEHVFDGGQILGGTLVQVGGAVATYAIGKVTHKRQVALVGADLLRAQLVNTVFTQGLKLSVNRTRPDGDPWSFPSGHSSGSFATATVLHRHFGWKVGAPAFALAGYVAASRLQERRHFASDVIFGAGLGIVSGRVVTVGRGPTRFALSPMAVPGRGAGISFTRLAN